MGPLEDLQALTVRSNRDLDEWNDFFEHTKAVWRGFEFWVNAGNKFRAKNAATGKEFTEADLIGLSQYYITQNLAPFVLQRFISVFEVFFFDFLRILLEKNPGNLGTTTFTLGELLAKGGFREMIQEAIDKKLNAIRYEKPKDWFDYLDTVQRLGCPSDDEIECLAEMKATRDVVEHNSGVVNKIYLSKAGRKARFKDNDYVEVTDPYLRECWNLLKKVCNDLATSAAKVLSLNSTAHL